MILLRANRNSPLSTYGAASLRLSGLFRDWLNVNCWTPSHFSSLTREYCAPSSTLSAKEVSDVLSSANLDLMPKYFQAFAEVDSGLCQYDIQASGALTDLNLLSCFAHSMSVDGSSSNASWWFAIYCGEEWANLKVDQGLSMKSHGISALGKIMPQLIRDVIASYGRDPVAYVRRASLDLLDSTSLRPIRYVNWVLEYSALEDSETRLALPFSLLLVSELGFGCETLNGIDRVADLCLSSLHSKLPHSSNNFLLET